MDDSGKQETQWGIEPRPFKLTRCCTTWDVKVRSFHNLTWVHQPSWPSK